MTRDELIEKVARGMCKADVRRCGCGEQCEAPLHNFERSLKLRYARAAIDIVLKEAAKVAEGVAPRTSVKSGDETEAFFLALDDAAAAIRALKSGDEE